MAVNGRTIPWEHKTTAQRGPLAVAPIGSNSDPRKSLPDPSNGRPCVGQVSGICKLNVSPGARQSLGSEVVEGVTFVLLEDLVTLLLNGVAYTACRRCSVRSEDPGYVPAFCTRLKEHLALMPHFLRLVTFVRTCSTASYV